MSAHGTMEINGHVIGRWYARRIRTSPVWNLYAYEVEQYETTIGLPFKVKGKLIHRASDGMLVLGSKVLLAAAKQRARRE